MTDITRTSTWSRSLAEEVISALWAIASILCFGFDFNVAGWLFATKAILDAGSSIYFAYREIPETGGRK